MKNIRKIFILSFILVLCSSICVKNIDAQYIKVYLQYQSDSFAFKKGNYKFVINSQNKAGLLNLKIYEGKKEIKSLKNVYDVITDGNKVFYMSATKIVNNIEVSASDIMKYDLKSKKTIKIKGFNKEISIEDLKGNDMYISSTEADYENEQGYLKPIYKLDINTKKQTKILESAQDIEIGENKIFYRSIGYDVSPRVLYCCDMNGKNTRKIADYALGYKFVKDKLYYVGSEQWDKMYLNIADKDGKNSKKISKNLGDLIDSGYVTKKGIYYVRYNSDDGSIQPYFLDFSTASDNKINEPKGYIVDID